MEVEGGWEGLVLSPKSIARELRFGMCRKVAVRVCERVVEREI